MLVQRDQDKLPTSGVPTNDVPWYTRRYLLKLNFIILSLVLFCKIPLQLSLNDC